MFWDQSYLYLHMLYIPCWDLWTLIMLKVHNELFYVCRIFRVRLQIIIWQKMSAVKGTGLFYQVILHLVLLYLFSGWRLIFWAELGYLAYLTYHLQKSEKIPGKKVFKISLIFKIQILVLTRYNLMIFLQVKPKEIQIFFHFSSFSSEKCGSIDDCYYFMEFWGFLLFL